MKELNQALRILSLRLDLEGVRRQRVKLELERSIDDVEDRMNDRDSCHTRGVELERELNERETAVLKALRALGWEEK